LKQLEDWCEWPVRERGGAAGRGLVFTEAYPDTRETGGVRALTEAGWNGLYSEFKIETEDEFVKHLLNWHDGEVRFVGETWWMEVETLPVYDGMMRPEPHQVLARADDAPRGNPQLVLPPPRWGS